MTGKLSAAPSGDLYAFRLKIPVLPKRSYVRTKSLRLALAGILIPFGYINARCSKLFDYLTGSYQKTGPEIFVYTHSDVYISGPVLYLTFWPLKLKTLMQ